MQQSTVAFGFVSNHGNQLSRHLGTPKQINGRALPDEISTSTSYPSPAAGHSSITCSPLWPLCVLLVLIRARSRPDPSQRWIFVEQRQGASCQATKLPMLSLRSYPRLTVSHSLTIHLSTTISPARTIVSRHPLK